MERALEDAPRLTVDDLRVKAVKLERYDRARRAWENAGPADRVLAWCEMQRAWLALETAQQVALERRPARGARLAGRLTTFRRRGFDGRRTAGGMSLSSTR